MSWITAWVAILGPGLLLIGSLAALVVFLIARTCSILRWVIPTTWALLVLALPVAILLMSWSQAEMDEIIPAFALPSLLAFAPMLGWIRYCTRKG